MSENPNGEHDTGVVQIDHVAVDSRTLSPEELNLLSQRLSAVAMDGFGEGFATPERIRWLLTSEHHVSFSLTADTREMVGFQMSDIFQVGEDKCLYYSRAIRKTHQRLGLARQLLLSSINLHAPSIVCAKSQNSAEILSFIKTMRTLGVHDVYPFSESTALRDTMVEVIAAKKYTVNPETGIIERSFQEGKLGDFTIERSHPEIADLEDILTQRGFQRKRGDALFYAARIPSQK